MIWINQKELATILGITARRIRQLKDDGLFVRDPKTKKYNLPKSVQEWIRYKVEAETATSATVNYETERAQHEEIKKKIAALRLRRYKGEIHEAADIEAVMSDMLVRFRGKLLAMPTKLAPMLVGVLDPNEIVDIIKAEVYEALTELSGYDPANFSAGVVIIDDDESENEEADPANM